MSKKQGIQRAPNRPPVHPGDTYKLISIPALGKSKAEIAKDLGISRQRLYDLTEGKAPFNPEMAIRFAKYFGGSAEVTLNLQIKYDLWHAYKEVDVSDIQPAAIVGSI